MQYIQEKAIFCEKCNKMTRHIRNDKKPNYLLHLILIIITGGFWIIPFLIILIGGVRIGGEAFRCEGCGEKYRSIWDIFFVWFLIVSFGILGLLFLIGVFL